MTNEELRAIEDAVFDYGKAEFRAGRADATEYVRAQMAAETARERVFDLLTRTANTEEIHVHIG